MRISQRSIIDVSLLILVNIMWAAQYAAYKTATEKMEPITVSAWPFFSPRWCCCRSLCVNASSAGRRGFLRP